MEALVPYPGTAGGSEAVGGEHIEDPHLPRQKDADRHRHALSPGSARPSPRDGRLLSALRSLSRQELKQLWRCSVAITDLNVGGWPAWSWGRGLTPPCSLSGHPVSVHGPGVFETGQFTYLQEHLRILSGFYGMLRPFDGVTPYRLEMQARLSVNGCPDLYAFWETGWPERWPERPAGGGPGLPGVQPERCSPPAPSVEVLTCTFGELQGRPGGGKGHAVQDGPGADGPLDGRARRPPERGAERLSGSGLPV